MNLFKDCQELTSQGKSFIVVTLVSVTGTVGGGKVEARAIKESIELLSKEESHQPLLMKWNLQKDIGMTCGGEVTFLFEVFKSESWPIVIFGAGHVAQALCQILKSLDCQITCIDPREEWIKKLNGIKAIIHPSPKELVQNFSPKSFFLSLTMGHAHDVPILEAISRHAPDAPYIGVIGSKVKGIKIKQELKEMGVNDIFLERLKVPMGLELGNNDPFEIAISITAELIQTRDQLRKQNV
jgi:xanthine dehydrogenase accessory factor